MLTIEQAHELTRKYVGKSFVFNSCFDDNPGWKDGDAGEIIRLYHPAIDKVRKDVFDLWQAKNNRTGDVSDVWACEITNSEGGALIEEHAEKSQMDKSGDTKDHPIIVRCPKCRIRGQGLIGTGSVNCLSGCGAFTIKLQIGKWYADEDPKPSRYVGRAGGWWSND